MQFYQQSLEILERLARANPDVVSIQIELAVNLNNIAEMLAQTGHTAPAMELNRRALALLDSLAVAAPDHVGLQVERARSDNAIGLLLSMTDAAGAVIASFDRALATYEGRVKANPGSSEVRRGLAASYCGLGRCWASMGKPGEAVEAFSRAVAALATATQPGPEDIFSLAASHALLASVAGVAGSGLTAAQGETQAESALAALRRAVSMGYRNTARLRSDAQLDSLRARPGFQILLMDLDMPRDPFAQRP
jgi:tetratricopeptide (TPR) repeat protein